MISDHDPAELPQASAKDDPSDHFLEALCPRCVQVVDAVCPCCHGHVEPAGTTTVDGAAQSTLPRAEFYRRFVSLIQSARNSKFTLGCYLIATGDAYADGVSMTEYARTWSVKKATVSKQCNFICEYLRIPPSRYMRSAASKESFRKANRRPTKIP